MLINQTLDKLDTLIATTGVFASTVHEAPRALVELEIAAVADLRTAGRSSE